MEFSGNYTVQVRSERIAAKEVGDEVAVYDLDTDKVHLLNATTARIWQACQGPTTVRAICEVIGDGAPGDEVQELVWRGLVELREAGLLTAASFLPPGVVPISRRSLLKKAGVAALAIPVITTIAAPPAAAQASVCGVQGTSCTTNTQCCTGLTCTKDAGQTTGVCGTCTTAGGTGCTGTNTAPCCTTSLPCTQVSLTVRKCCKTTGGCTGNAQCCSGNCQGSPTGSTCKTCLSFGQTCGNNNDCCSGNCPTGAIRTCA